VHVENWRISQERPVVNLSMHDAHEIASCDFGICEAKQHQHYFRSAILMNPGWLKFARRREKRRTTFSVWRSAFGVWRSALEAR